MTDSRVLSETCAQLGGALSHDLPAAAILRRPEVTLALLSLLRTSELAELGELASAALQTAAELLDRLLADLQAAADAPERFPPISAEAAAADAARSGATDHASATGQGSPTGDGSGAGGAGGAGDAGGVLPSGSARADGWAPWQVADALWTAVTPLLRHPDAAPAAVPLLGKALPLLYVPPPPGAPVPTVAGGGASQAIAAGADPRDDARVQSEAADLWRGYLTSMLAVLRFHRLLVAAAAPATPPLKAAEEGEGEEEEEEEEGPSRRRARPTRLGPTWTRPAGLWCFSASLSLPHARQVSWRRRRRPACRASLAGAWPTLILPFTSPRRTTQPASA